MRLGAGSDPEYEVDLWTPELTFQTPGDLSVVYSVQSGTFIRLSRLVTALWHIETSTWTWSTASGEFRIEGLPFTVDGQRAIGSFQADGWSQGDAAWVVPEAVAGLNEMRIIAARSNADVFAWTQSQVATGGPVRLRGTITYIIA